MTELNDTDFRRQTGERIACYRKMNGMTQSALAEKLNYTDKAISKWERGESLPDIFVIMRIAELFGITPNDLLGVKTTSETSTTAIENAELHRRKKIKHGLVTALSVLLVWFVVSVLFFVLDFILNDIKGLNEPRIALVFLYAVPISFTVMLVFSCIWGRHWQQAACVGGILWGAVASFIVTVGTFNVTKKLSSAVFIAAAVFQILDILWFVMRRLLRKKK